MGINKPIDFFEIFDLYYIIRGVCIMWKKAKGLIRPLDAPMSGYEKENAVFIARTNFKDGVHPCKFVDNYGCYVSYGYL